MPLKSSKEEIVQPKHFFLDKGHVKNNEAEKWQNGHEPWIKMNSHFDAPHTREE